MPFGFGERVEEGAGLNSATDAPFLKEAAPQVEHGNIQAVQREPGRRRSESRRIESLAVRCFGVSDRSAQARVFGEPCEHKEARAESGIVIGAKAIDLRRFRNRRAKGDTISAGAQSHWLKIRWHFTEGACETVLPLARRKKPIKMT